MSIVFWGLAAICAALILALGIALRRLYALQVALPGKPAAGGSLEFPAGWEKLDELLNLLLSLQEHGVSRSSGNVSREDFAQTALDISCRLMKCARGTVMLWDAPAGCLRIAAAKSARSEKAQKLFLKPGEGAAGKAFASGQTILVSNPDRDPRYIQGGTQDSEPFISIPLLVQSKPVGVLNLHATAGTEPFTGYKAKFLNLLAGETAVMLHNQDLLDNLQTSCIEMMQALARAADFKDACAREHADRARSLARRLAAELKLPDQMTRHIEYAALLHDIGKIGIDRSILIKPGKLTPDEREAMKRHPVIGHQILSPVKHLAPVAQMVLYHQECYDGRGYPEGLRGEEIPLGARVVAVIDAWDAMRSDRPYHKALTREAAIAELRRCAGSQFDPKIVAAFLRVEAADEAPGANGAREGQS